MYKYEDIKAVHLELTERCQAACPMCPRTGNAELRNAELYLDDIKLIFPEDFVNQLTHFSLCGNYGEPIVARDCLEVVEYLKSTNPNIFISINTNAGARSKEWWIKLANILGNKGVVKFGIDGLQDTNHIYRVNVKWENVYNNAKYFIDAGGRAWWDFIGFAHNEHQIEQANKLADTMGFEKFRVKKSYRFGVFHGIDLKPPTQKNKAMDLFKQGPDFFNSCLIDCKVSKSKEIFISAEGLLFPCCWTAGTRYGHDHQIRNLIGALDNIDCKKYSIKDIMEGGIMKRIEQTWTMPSIDQGKLRICSVQCNAKYDIFSEQYND